jgi:hypothetical protein
MHLPNDGTSVLVCVDSMSSKAAYPHNLKGSFSCRLASPLENKSASKIYIRPTCIAISRRIIHPQPPPSHLKLHIYELEEQRSGKDYTHCLASFSLDQDVEGVYCTHTFTNTPYLPLRIQRLAELHVAIRDNRGRDVLFLDGPPTLLWLEMTTQPKTEDQFLIHNLSYHPQLYPGNTQAEFSSPLPTALHLPGYEVALYQLAYPPFLTEPADEVSLQINELTFTYDLNVLKTTRDFIRKVMIDVMNTPYGDELEFSIRAEPTFACFFSRRRLPDRQQGRIVVTPSPNFTRACGQISQPRGPTIIEPGTGFRFSGAPSIYLAKPNPVAMLHCNIITPNIVGEKKGHLLQCVPVLHNITSSGERLYEPPQLIFQAVREMPFDSIHFAFREADGRVKNFTSRFLQHPVLVTLVFRKIKQ